MKLARTKIQKDDFIEECGNCGMPFHTGDTVVYQEGSPGWVPDIAFCSAHCLYDYEEGLINSIR